MPKLSYKLNLKSGNELRKYRRHLAERSTEKSLDSMLTLKFRLKPLGTSFVPAFDTISKMYGLVEGTGKGSLTYLLFATVLSGFRLFGSYAQAKAFASNSKGSDDAFYQAFKNASGLDLPDFVPGKILVRLRKAVRKTKGKNNTFTKEVIADQYKKDLGKFRAGSGTDPDKVDGLFLQIGEVLESQFADWAEVNSKALDACRAIDDLLKQEFSDGLPSIRGAAEFNEKKSAALPDGSSIAFDPSSVLYKANTPLACNFVIAVILGRAGGAGDSKYVKNNLTTQTNNALSWLFGKGLRLLRTENENTLADMYGVPFDRIECIRQLKEAAKAVTPPAEFGELCSLAKFRSSLGGKLDSWVSNYVKRLNELKALLASLPENLKLPQEFAAGSPNFVKWSGCRLEEIESLLNLLHNKEKVKDVRAALDTLLGLNTQNIDASLIRKVADFSESVNQLGAIREQLDNSLENLNAGSPYRSLLDNKAVKDEWDKWKQLKKLPKINSLSGGIPDAQAMLKETLALHEEVLSGQKTHFERIRAWINAQDPDFSVFSKEVLSEQAKLQARGLTKDPKEQALRHILDGFARCARKYGHTKIGGELIAWFKDSNVFETPKWFNRYFFNHLGAIYKSPYSTNNNSPYTLSTETLSDPKACADDLLALAEKLSSNQAAADAEEIRAKSDLRSLWMSFYIRGITKPVPKKIAQPELKDELYESSMPAKLKLRLSDPETDSGILNSVFNVYKSLLSGYEITLYRQKFFLRAKFSWVGNNVLSYLPKEREWNIPQRYFNHDLWKQYRDLGLVTAGGATNTLDTFDKICAELKSKTQRVDLRPLLVQLPHDWVYKLPFAHDVKDDSRNAVTVLDFSKNSKSEVADIRKYDINDLAKLICPPSYANRLDSIILHPEAVSVSDMNLLADEEVEQNLNSGAIQLWPQPLQLSLAVPIMTQGVQSLEMTPFKRIVAIDQGEVGFSYAVFNLSDCGKTNAQPIDTGTVPVPSIRRLIKRVKSYRKNKQSIQKFNQKFDSTMFNIRENVTGDVCGLIVALMKKYNAFPVLEYQVKNFETGSRQLSLVYKAVNARFLLSNVDMQNALRKSWWYQGDKWETNLQRLSAVQDGSDKKAVLKNGKWYRPFFLFPGSSVNAYMTSRICHECGRNPITLLREDAKGDKKKIYEINNCGEVKIGGEILKLYQRPGNQTPVPGMKPRHGRQRSYASLKERAPWVDPVKAQKISAENLEKMIRANMRRAPKSMRSKDTSQSEFFCVFKDCRCHNQRQHADVNAAINIGRRFLEETIINS